MTLTTLVVGASAAVREAALAAIVDPTISTACILEGITTGLSPLEPLAEQGTIQIARIAPGCMCCVGNLTLRVTLNRILRRPPQRLFISLATSAHHAQISNFLTQAPYDALLSLTGMMHCD